MENATPDPEENKHRRVQAVVFFSTSFSVQRVVVERGDAHRLLLGGVDGKRSSTQGAIFIV